MKKIIMMVCVVSIIAAGVFASEELTGSDYVRLGKLDTITGTLREEQGEWYLDSKKTEYDVHLGNYEVIYPEGIGLKAGDEAKVKGFVFEDQISAVSISTKAGSWNFRDDTGRPLWSGRGRGANANNPMYVHD